MSAVYYVLRSDSCIFCVCFAGSFVLGVTAVDQDVGDNGVVEYSLKPGGHAAYFTVDPDTGVITASRDLQRSMGNTLQITVIATDKVRTLIYHSQRGSPEEHEQQATDHSDRSNVYHWCVMLC